jgi:hypothetical protein
LYDEVLFSSAHAHTTESTAVLTREA